jgi:hypothetical protein
VTSDLGAVADAFGLGRPLGAPDPLSGGGTARRWRLRTDRGTWMVKTHRDPALWEREQMRDAGALERAAYAAGVAMPRPLAPPAPSIGLWHAVGPGYARVCEWVDGVTPPADPMPLATWLGETMAAIDRLALPADPATGVAYTLYPMADWHRWLDDAHAACLLDRAATADLKAAVAEATALVEAGLATGPAFRLGHRDANCRNFLLTDRGPVLIDFDSAGPEVPWWGAVYAAWDHGRPDIATIGPTVLDAYAAHGGRLGPADATAFAGAFRAVLDQFAFHLRLATGHPGDPERLAASRRMLPLFRHGVPEMLDLVDGWVRLLR